MISVYFNKQLKLLRWQSLIERAKQTKKRKQSLRFKDRRKLPITPLEALASGALNKDEFPSEVRLSSEVTK